MKTTLSIVIVAAIALAVSLFYNAAAGLNPAALFTCTVLGAQSSAISPFSSGGFLILGSCGSEEERGHLFNRLLFVAVPISVGICAVYNFVISMIL